MSDKFWIVVADGASARILRPRLRGEGFVVLYRMSGKNARKHSAELGNRPPGRSYESASVLRHAVEPRSDPQRKEKDRFVRRLADRLNRAAKEKTFEALSLVAPAGVSRQLQEQFESACRSRLKEVREKDLVWVPDNELYRHLGDLKGLPRKKRLARRHSPGQAVESL